MSFQIHKTFVRIQNKFFWPCIESNATATFKAQKGSKDIIKIVHVMNGSRNWAEEKKLLNQVHIFFVFFAQNVFS